MMFIETGKYRSDAKRHLMVQVDDADFLWLSKYNWHASPLTGAVSALGGGKKTLMHRLIMQAPAHLEVDHIDGNRLNNQRLNLRLCNSSQNKMNRPARKDNTSGYKGVSLHKQTQKWSARIKIGDVYEHLGLFDTKELAALAYNNAALEHHREFANLNAL